MIAPRGRFAVRHDAPISARYELIRFLARLGVAVAAAGVLAIAWALAHGGPFRHSLVVGLYVVGAFALVLGAAGGSPSRRDAASASWRGRWASADTFAANRASPPDQTLGPIVVLGVIGLALIALGWAIS